MAKKEFEELVLEKLGSMDWKIWSMDLKIDTLTEDVSILKIKVDKIDNRVSDIETKVDKIDNRVSDIDLKVERLDIKATQMDYKLSGLELKLTHVDKNVDGLYDENHSIQQSITTNGQYINQAFQRISENLSTKI